MENYSDSELKGFYSFRGFLILMVVLFHFTFRFNEIYPEFNHSQNIFLNVNHGYFFVNIFFILSGFFVLRSVFEKSPEHFIVSRMKKILPEYWISVPLIFLIVSYLGLPGREATFLDMLLNFGFFNIFFGRPYVDAAHWAIEKFILFYIFVYLIKKFDLMPKLKHIIYILAVISLLFLYFIGSSIVQENHLIAGVLLLISKIFFMKQFYLFGFGMLLFMSSKKNEIYFHFLMFLAVSFLIDGQIGAMFLVGFFIIAFLLIKWGGASSPIFYPLSWLGGISYPLYLVHQNIGYAIIRQSYALGINPNMAVVFAIAIAIILSVLVSRISATLIKKIDL